MKTYRGSLNRCLPLVALAGLLCIPVLGADAPPKSTRPVTLRREGRRGKADRRRPARRPEGTQAGAPAVRRQLVRLVSPATRKLFQSDEKIAARLKKSYVVVLMDVNKDHNAAIDQQYSNPIQHGLPVIVILDAEGKALVTQDTGQAGRRRPSRPCQGAGVLGPVGHQEVAAPRRQ